MIHHRGVCPGFFLKGRHVNVAAFRIIYGGEKNGISVTKNHNYGNDCKIY